MGDEIALGYGKAVEHRNAKDFEKQSGWAASATGSGQFTEPESPGTLRCPRLGYSVAHRKTSTI